jgi:hypothetical protein
MIALVITNIVLMALICAAVVGLLAGSVLISARENTVRPATRRVARRRTTRTRVLGRYEGLKA